MITGGIQKLLVGTCGQSATLWTPAVSSLFILCATVKCDATDPDVFLVLKEQWALSLD